MLYTFLHTNAANDATLKYRNNDSRYIFPTHFIDHMSLCASELYALMNFKIYDDETYLCIILVRTNMIDIL